MKLRVGQVLVSAVDTTSIILTRVPPGDVSLTCGGVEMYVKGGTAPEAEPDRELMQGSLLGKRYVDAAGTIEVLCTKEGKGSLALNGQPLMTGAAKSLPSTD